MVGCEQAPMISNWCNRLNAWLCVKDSVACEQVPMIFNQIQLLKLHEFMITKRDMESYGSVKGFRNIEIGTFLLDVTN